MGHEQQHRERGAGHLLLFPFLAQGHFAPFLNLAKRIECVAQQPRPAITIASTARIVARLRRAVPAGSSIRFAELPFSPSNHGLHPEAESTDAISYRDMAAFFFATDSLRPPFEKLLSDLAARDGCNNVCVVADIFLGWTAETARELGVQHRVFLTSGAYASAAVFSIWLRPPKFPRPVVNPDADEQPLVDFSDVSVTYAEFMKVAVTEDPSNPMTLKLRRALNHHFQYSGGLVINTADDIEPKGLEMIGKISGLPTFAVGPLIGGSAPRTPTTAEEDACIMRFLDSKPAGSVLYVSFGSQSTIPLSEMMELARGLEASGRPFIWAVRPPQEFDGAVEFRADEWLPAGFEARAAAASQGVVVKRWAPQCAILAHASTGAFLSHCGWNSVLESLWHGVPVLAWPLRSDQLFDSRVLVEQLNVGVEVASGKMFGGIKEEEGWEHVRDAVEMVLGDGEKAQDMRRRAAKVKAVARAAADVDGEVKGSSVLAMERLLDGAFLR